MNSLVHLQLHKRVALTSILLKLCSKKSLLATPALRRRFKSIPIAYQMPGGGGGLPPRGLEDGNIWCQQRSTI